MEILNTKNIQMKSQDIVVKPVRNSVYGGSIKTVKQRAHKFNAIAISNINNPSTQQQQSNGSNIPIPNKSIVNGSSKVLNQIQLSNEIKSLNNSKSTNCEVSTTSNSKVDNNNNNHNIKINIVNKYISSKNTTLVDHKKMNSEVEKLSIETTKIIEGNENNNNNNNNVMMTTTTTANRILKAGDVKNKINQLNQATNVASVSPSKSSSSTAMVTSSSSFNTSGWIRIFCGPDRSEFSCEDPNRMVLVYVNSTASEIVKEMTLPGDYTLWVQIGGKKSRRLDDGEQPLIIQEEFLKKLGYVDESRRSRLAIDQDLKYLIRFHIGPTGTLLCLGAQKCGNVELLKGFIFPQWTRRTIAIIGTKLIVYPSNASLMPEVYDLSSSEIFEHSPVYNRLIIKIVPKINDSTEIDCLSLLKSSECLNSKTTNNGSNLSVCSNGTTPTTTATPATNADRNVVLFLGFEDSWERDLWSNWLMEATTELSEPRRMDISGSGLHIMPEVILQSSSLVEELFADHNKLQESALKALTDLKKLRVLKVTANQLKRFPDQIMDIMNLTVLDISKNEIDRLPDNVFKMEKLEELRIDDNLLTTLPNTLKLLRNLRSISVSNNKITQLPDFMIAMRFNNSIDYSKQSQHHDGSSDITPRIDYSNPPLKKLNLRANSLKGNIIIGNFNYLTQLDMSENSIEFLDLSALDKIESVQCCKNQIKELTLNGRVLNSLVASHNKLFRLIVKPLPKSIRHIDVSYNQLTEVPEWLNECHQLRTLYANNNNISILPENLFQNENGMLHTIQLACNKLTKLPAMPKKLLPIQELYVNGNQIEDLPEYFFCACENLILLNVSNNKLVMLPILDGNRSHLERLYASNNNLHDRVLDTLMSLSNLRILHLSYNRLTAFPECCISNWPEIEELNISGNKIQHLPENLANCRNLRVLRAHSNQLQSTPILSKLQSLRVLDLAHNQLDKINLTVLVPKKLQFLDLSCNVQLQVDAKQLQNCRSQRPISLVDVSGKNRSSLPTAAPTSANENVDFELPWKIGFSETTGNANKLYISQLRLPNFCNVEGLFGMFDGESSNSLPNILVKAIPKILVEERTVKETSNDYMKYTLLSAHRELKQQGQKSGVTATLCHIARMKINADNPYNAFQNGASRKFVLRVATVGDCSAILIRDKGYMKLTAGSSHTKIGCSSNYPMTVPDPLCNDITLTDHDEFLVIANRKLWDVMTPENVMSEVKKEENVLLAAKRLQDIAQSYGAEENLSVIVVGFNNLGSDIDFLMRELRHTIKKKPNGSVISGFCKCGCCCENNSNSCHGNNNDLNAQFNRQPSSRSDRSSPSGQSDQSISDNQSQTLKEKINAKTLKKPITDDKKSLKTGIARAVRARIEEERENKNNESDSMMSEEQFKCWEYMLEQNTQLLFDKELNTISKAFTKRNQSNLNRKHVRSLSTSTPIIANQLDPKGLAHFNSILGSTNSNSSTALNLRHAELPNNVFLSKHFGSARSFQQGSQNFFKPIRMNPAGASPRLLTPMMTGGPNAAYFGSLQRLNMGTDAQNLVQRLMPYNLEYDFEMIKERPLAEEVEAVNETDNSRMQHYWGVATTEL